MIDIDKELAGIDGAQSSLIKQLRNSGKINDHQITALLEEYKQTGVPISKILVRKGIVSEALIICSMCADLGIMYVNIEKEDISPAVLAKFPAEFLRKYKCMPVFIKNNVLRIALSNPYDICAMDAVRDLINNSVDLKTLQLEFVCSPETKLNIIIDNYYPQSHHEIIHQTIDTEIENSIRELETLKEIEESSQPIKKLTDRLIELGLLWNASDIHICPEEDHVQTRYRIDGVLFVGPSLPIKLKNPVITRVKLLAKLDISEHRVPQDGKFVINKDGRIIDLRVSCIPVIYGESLVMRILERTRLIDLENLGLESEILDSVQRMLSKTSGMFIVCGPTGSGKSTTLYAFLMKMNALEKNIITLEDPVEYQIPFVCQSQINPSANYNFSNGLRAFLRHDPDIIMVGEIRDRETANMAVHAAQTGHMVFSTLHTNTAIGAISRFSHMGIDIHLLSSVLDGALAQRLVRKVCVSCRESYKSPALEISRLGLKTERLLYKGKGCSKCMGTGYKDRIGIFELFTPDDEIRRLILSQASEIEIKKAAQKKNMKFLHDDAKVKVCQGVTSFAEVARVLSDSGDSRWQSGTD